MGHIYQLVTNQGMKAVLIFRASETQQTYVIFLWLQETNVKCAKKDSSVLVVRFVQYQPQPTQLVPIMWAVCINLLYAMPCKPV